MELFLLDFRHRKMGKSSELANIAKKLRLEKRGAYRKHRKDLQRLILI